MAWNSTKKQYSPKELEDLAGKPAIRINSNDGWTLGTIVKVKNKGGDLKAEFKENERVKKPALFKIPIKIFQSLGLGKSKYVAFDNVFPLIDITFKNGEIFHVKSNKKESRINIGQDYFDLVEIESLKVGDYVVPMSVSETYQDRISSLCIGTVRGTYSKTDVIQKHTILVDVGFDNQSAPFPLKYRKIVDSFRFEWCAYIDILELYKLGEILELLDALNPDLPDITAYLETEIDEYPSRAKDQIRGQNDVFSYDSLKNNMLIRSCHNALSLRQKTNDQDAKITVYNNIVFCHNRDQFLGSISEIYLIHGDVFVGVTFVTELEIPNLPHGPKCSNRPFSPCNRNFLIPKRFCVWKEEFQTLCIESSEDKTKADEPTRNEILPECSSSGSSSFNVDFLSATPSATSKFDSKKGYDLSIFPDEPKEATPKPTTSASSSSKKDLENLLGNYAEKSIVSESTDGVDFMSANLKKLSSSDSFPYGIQGELNSCYLDVSLFLMFAFNQGFDDLIFQYVNSSSRNAEKKAKVSLILAEIAEKLRMEFYVPSSYVMKLRKLLKDIDAGFVGSFMDVEDVFLALFEELFSNTFFELDSGGHNVFHQIVVPNEYQGLEAPQRIKEIQNLLYDSFWYYNVKLVRKPNAALILKLPYCNGKSFFGCNYVLPNLELDLSPLMVEKSKAKDENLSKSSMKMELFGIICLKSSHYVCFAKTGEELLSPWVYFDSNPIQMKPRVELLPDLGKYLIALEKEPNILLSPCFNELCCQNAIKYIAEYCYMCFYR